MTQFKVEDDGNNNDDEDEVENIIISVYFNNHFVLPPSVYTLEFAEPITIEDLRPEVYVHNEWLRDHDWGADELQFRLISLPIETYFSYPHTYHRGDVMDSQELLDGNTSLELVLCPNTDDSNDDDSNDDDIEEDPPNLMRYQFGRTLANKNLFL